MGSVRTPTSIHAALIAGDAATSEALVDWDRLRSGLRSDFTAVIVQEATSKQEGAFAALGAMMGGAIVDRMIDGYVNPSEIAMHTKGLDSPFDEIIGAYSFVSPSVFHARFKPASDGTAMPASLILELGNFSWRLTRVLIDRDEFRRVVANSRSIQDQLMNEPETRQKD